MNWKPAALLALLLALAGCASEGGSRGSGISTTVEGNVAAVHTSALPARPLTTRPTMLAKLRTVLQIEQSARAVTGIEGVRVVVEGTEAQDQTDSNGEFSIRGDFEGLVNLVFQLPDDGGPARLAINVPAGGTLTLNNIRVDTQSGAASAETQNVDFTGIVTAANCQNLTITLVSSTHSPNDDDHYMVQLSTSSIEDIHGNALSCADLREGERAEVHGVVNADGTFGQAVIQLQE